MRLLFISPNRWRGVVPPLPLGLASVIACLGPEHKVRVLDFMFLDDPLKELARVVAEFSPDLVGVGVRNIDNQDSREPLYFFEEIKDLMVRLRQISAAPVLLGGAGFSIFPRELMEYLDADLGLMGEGEESLPLLLAAFPKQEWERIPGLVWGEPGKRRLNPMQPVADLERLPPPALEYFTPRLYQEALGSAKLPGVVPVQTRRGCPMKCIYCTTRLLEGRRCRTRAPQQVAAWLSAWHEKWGLTRFYFVDNIFNHPTDFARRLCEAIRDLGLPLEWSCLINPAFPDRELFRLIHRAGGTTVQVGNESGSELVLSRLGKGFSRRQVELTLSLLQEEGLPYTCFLMLGGPGETPDTVRESVALLEEYQPLLVNLTVGVRIYPGLPLYRLALEEGLLTPQDNLLWPRFYLAPAVRDWIWEYLKEVMARHPNWIF